MLRPANRLAQQEDGGAARRGRSTSRDPVSSSRRGRTRLATAFQRGGGARPVSSISMRLAWKAVPVLCAAFAGCGDTAHAVDAGADSIAVPEHIVVSGAVQEMIAGAQKPCTQCALFFHTAAPGFLAHTQTDAQGNYTMTVPTGGAPLAGADVFAESVDTTEPVFALSVFF